MQTHAEFPGLTAHVDTDEGFDPAQHGGFRVVYREDGGDWNVVYVDGTNSPDEATSFVLALAGQAGHVVQSYGVNEWTPIVGG